MASGSSAGVSPVIRELVMIRDRFTCAACGLRGYKQVTPSGVAYPTEMAGVSLSIDHLLPRSLGGSSADLRNLRVLCTRCNSKKGARVIAAGGKD